MYFLSEQQIQRIKDTIIGVNVVLNDSDFGNVVDVETEIDNGNVALFAKTDSGYYFNAFELYQLYRRIYDNVADKVYPKDYTPRRSNLKAKGFGRAINGAAMPKHARIGNESINITERP